MDSGREKRLVASCLWARVESIFICLLCKFWTNPITEELSEYLCPGTAAPSEFIHFNYFPPALKSDRLAGGN